MAELKTGVIKKNHVRTAAPGSGAAHARTNAAPPADAAPGPAQVRVAEMHDDHAILEVRCPCGELVHVRCRWPAEAPAAN
jgi:hypothetical protein